MGQYSLMVDIWSSINWKAFLGLTIHYVDSEWHLKNFLFDIISFSISYFEVNIAQEIMRVLNKFNIFDKVIVLIIDNESAILVCGRNIMTRDGH